MGQLFQCVPFREAVAEGGFPIQALVLRLLGDMQEAFSVSGLTHAIRIQACKNFRALYDVVRLSHQLLSFNAPYPPHSRSQVSKDRFMKMETGGKHLAGFPVGLWQAMMKNVDMVLLEAAMIKDDSDRAVLKCLSTYDMEGWFSWFVQNVSASSSTHPPEPTLTPTGLWRLQARQRVGCGKERGLSTDASP